MGGGSAKALERQRPRTRIREKFINLDTAQDDENFPFFFLKRQCDGTSGPDRGGDQGEFCEGGELFQE